MRIIAILLGMFLLILAAYVADLAFTAGNLMTNVLQLVGIGGAIVQSPKDVVVSVLAVAATVLMVLTLITIGRAIRRREGV